MNEIIDVFLDEIFLDFKQMLKEAIKQNPESFSCTMSCLRFLKDLHDLGISADFTIFDNRIQEKVLEELKTYFFS